MTITEEFFKRIEEDHEKKRQEAMPPEIAAPYGILRCISCGAPATKEGTCPTGH